MKNSAGLQRVHEVWQTMKLDLAMPQKPFAGK
jgi:hypothetical protein